MPTATAPRKTARRLPVAEYVITWIWAQNDPDRTPYVDHVQASTATRAIGRLVKDLSAEYADVRKNIRVLDAIRNER